MGKRIVIIGAGPTGLGAAYRLQELGYKNWDIYEKELYIGGLAASFVDGKGFTWDIGGHVIFSHYKYFDGLVDKLLGNDFTEHFRESWIWMMERFVPYPFQNNLGYLPKDKLLECVVGLINAREIKDNPSNFKEWLISAFGEGISKHFMVPYNLKVWAYPLEKMDKGWIAERVSIVDIERVLRNVIYEQDDKGWGPNNRFKFPLKGGTGGLFKRFEPYISGRLRTNKELTRIDLSTKVLTFKDGSRTSYDFLINTSPLNVFSGKLAQKDETLIRAAGDLKYTGGLMVGIGLKKECPSSKCWVYFPQGDSPFYRVTYFSNYSPNNCPSAGYYSLLCETSYSEFKNDDKGDIVERTIQGLINSGFLSEEDRSHIVSTFCMDIPLSYPVPSLTRDNALKHIQGFLEKKGIYSRGRFGAWKYEIGNGIV